MTLTAKGGPHMEAQMNPEPVRSNLPIVAIVALLGLLATISPFFGRTILVWLIDARGAGSAQRLG